MRNGAYRTQCRRCSSVVYDGPWILPTERLQLQQDHRKSCTADIISIRAPLSTSSQIATTNSPITHLAYQPGVGEAGNGEPRSYDAATVAGMVAM